MEETFDQMSTPPDDFRCQSPFWYPQNQLGAEEDWWASTWFLRNENTLGTRGLIACCLQDDVQCLRHTQTSPSSVHVRTHKQTCTAIWIRMCYHDVLPKRVTNHGVTGLFRQTWLMVLPMRDECREQEKGLSKKRSRQSSEVRVT